MQQNKLNVFIGSAYPYLSNVKFISIVSLFLVKEFSYSFYNMCKYKNDVSNNYKKLVGKKKILRYI